MSSLSSFLIHTIRKEASNRKIEPRPLKEPEIGSLDPVGAKALPITPDDDGTLS